MSVERATPFQDWVSILMVSKVTICKSGSEKCQKNVRFRRTGMKRRGWGFADRILHALPVTSVGFLLHSGDMATSTVPGVCTAHHGSRRDRERFAGSPVSGVCALGSRGVCEPSKDRPY
jgi:hypothetical protein